MWMSLLRLADDAEAQMALRRHDKHGSKQRGLVTARAKAMDSKFGSFSVMLHITRCGSITIGISQTLQSFMRNWTPEQQQQVHSQLQNVSLALAAGVKAQQHALPASKYAD